MTNNLPSQGHRITAVRDRLYEALGAANAAEGEIIRYLTRALPVEACELLASMATRAVSTARAEGYEQGWAEGVEHGRKGGER